MIQDTFKTDFLSSPQKPGAAPCPLARRSRVQRGQATIEYVLLIGTAALIGIGFMSTFNKVIQDGILTFNATLEAELVGGGFDEAATGWEN